MIPLYSTAPPRIIPELTQSPNCMVVVRGPKPTVALKAREVRIDRSATAPYTTGEVIESLEDLPLEGERVVAQRYGETNLGLEKALQ